MNENTIEKIKKPSVKYILISLLILFGFHYLTIQSMVLKTFRYQENWYSFMVPFFIVFILIKKKQVLELQYNPRNRPSIWLYIATAIAYSVGALTGMRFISEISVICHLCAFCTTIISNNCLKEIWPLFVYFFAFIPPPLFISEYIFAPLKGLYANAVQSSFMSLGLPALNNANTIFFPAFDFKIVDECNGFRSLLTLVMFALPFTTIAARTTSRRVFLILLSLPVALTVNFFRIVTTALTGNIIGVYTTRGSYHTAAGMIWIFIAFILMILISLSLKSERFLVCNQIKKTRPPFFMFFRPFVRQWGWCLLIIPIILSWLTLYPHLRSNYKNANYYVKTASAFAGANKSEHVVEASFRHFRSVSIPNESVLRNFTMAMMALKRNNQAIETLESIYYRNSEISILNAKPVHLYLLALLYFENTDYNISLYLLNNATRQLNTKVSDFLRMLNMFSLQRYEESIDILNKLIYLDSSNLLYLVLKAECMMRLGKSDEDVTFLLNILKSTSDGKKQSERILGNFYALNNQPYKAIKHYENAYKIGNINEASTICINAFIAATSIENKLVIEKWVKRLEKVAPNHSFVSLYKTINSMLNTKHGIRLFKEIFGRTRGNKNLLKLVEASIYLKKGEFKKTRNCLNFVLSVLPNDFRARILLVELLIAENKSQQALNIIKSLESEKQLKKSLGNHFILLKAKACFLNKNFKECISLLDGLKDIDFINERKKEIMMYRSASLAGKGDRIAAVEAAERLVQIAEKIDENENNTINFLFWAAQVFERSGKVKRASEIYEKCILDKRFAPICHNNLAWYFYDQNQLDKSYYHALNAYKLKPNHPGIMDTMAWISFKNNKIEDAKEIYTKLLKENSDKKYIDNYNKVLKQLSK